MSKFRFRTWDKKAKVMEQYQYLQMSPNGQLYHDGMNVTDNYEIMQYTGVKDDNGTEIYEGDILRIVSNFELRKDVQNQAVDCSEGCFGTDEWALFELLRNRNRRDKSESQTFEVIGNIYEHPWLLEN